MDVSNRWWTQPVKEGTKAARARPRRRGRGPRRPRTGRNEAGRSGVRHGDETPNARPSALKTHVDRREKGCSSVAREATKANPGCPGCPGQQITMPRSMAGRFKYCLRTVCLCPRSGPHRAHAEMGGASFLVRWRVQGRPTVRGPAGDGSLGDVAADPRSAALRLQTKARREGRGEWCM